MFWDSQSNSVKVYDIEKKRWKNIMTWKNYERNYLYMQELSHFLQCVKQRTQTINPVTEGIETLKIALAIIKSSKSKRVLAV